MKLTNKKIQAQVSGTVEKTCWSMLWQRKELSVSDLTKKGYKENSVRKAFKKFVSNGWAKETIGVKNYIEITEGIENGGF